MCYDYHGQHCRCKMIHCNENTNRNKQMSQTERWEYRNKEFTKSTEIKSLQRGNTEIAAKKVSITAYGCSSLSVQGQVYVLIIQTTLYMILIIYMFIVILLEKMCIYRFILWIMVLLIFVTVLFTNIKLWYMIQCQFPHKKNLKLCANKCF